MPQLRSRTICVDEGAGSTEKIKSVGILQDKAASLYDDKVYHVIQIDTFTLKLKLV